MIEKMAKYAMPMMTVLRNPLSERWFLRLVLITLVTLNMPIFWMLAPLDSLEEWARNRGYNRLERMLSVMIEIGCVPHLVSICIVALIDNQFQEEEK